MEVGLRVVRGPDWIWGDQDGGEGSVGTVVRIGGDGDIPLDMVWVYWDIGRQGIYRAGYSGKYDLLVFDSAQAGVKHDDVSCDGCRQYPIFGIRWKCFSCPDYDLCSACFMNDLHEAHDEFLRCDHDCYGYGILVRNKTGSMKSTSRGFFTGAKVSRGKDWKWLDQDGGSAQVGTLYEITNWNVDDRSAAGKVIWNKYNYSNIYRIGYGGFVDLRCVTPAGGPSYYPECLAKVGDKELDMDRLVADRILDDKSELVALNDSTGFAHILTGNSEVVLRNVKKYMSGGEATSRAPSEILARGPRALQAYQKALVEGKTSVNRVPIMFIGQSQSGKTSLKRSLKGERFDPEETSTRGIEMDPSYCKVSTEVWKLGDKTQATYSDPMPISYEHCTAQYILSNLKEERREKGGEERKELESTLVRNGNVVMDDGGPSNKDRRKHSPELSHELPWIHDTLRTRPEVPNAPDLPEMPEEIAGLIVKLLEVVDNEEGEDIYSILWDFGGQSVYYATHPLFLTTRAIYCLVYNLSRNPDETVRPQVKHGFFKNVEDVYCERSNMDYLNVWMSSVSRLVPQDDNRKETSASEVLPERLPPVFLVCTHADKPFNGAHPKELAREIFGSLQTKSYGKHLTDFFVVDNTKSGSDQECPEVTRLRRDVLNVAKELPQTSEAIPIKWLRFEKAVKVMLGDGFKWISLEEARKIALDVCGISSDEQFEAVLNFLHDQRILIHFDDTPELSKMVILDLQWLIDVFKKIITITPYDSTERKFSELWLKLETTGILEEKLLQHVWGALFDNRETCDSLIAMMEKFCLLCPWSSSAESELPKEYLIPSMLISPPKEDVTKLISSAGIQSLFVKFDYGQVPPGLFPRLVLMVYQWCTKEWSCHSHPQLHHNFARFFTHPAEGCSLVLFCHSSSIEVVVHKEDCTAEISITTPPEMNLSSESSYDAFQRNVARTVCRQLGLMLECMCKEFHWLKNMTHEMSVCCPVCCRQGTANHCRSHNVRGCKQEECLHFWSESQLQECQGPVICTKSAVAGDYRVSIELFGCWFRFKDEQKAIVRSDTRALPCKKGDSAQPLILPSGVLEAFQLQTCDANGVVARLRESLSLEQASLEQPDPETKQRIRCLCMKAKTANRLDVVKKLREIAPAGTTGPLLPEALDVKNIPYGRRKELTINLCGGDEWKPFAERLGLNPAEIRFLDKRLLDPCDAALAHSRNQGYISSVGDLYDALVDCELPVMADLL